MAHEGLAVEDARLFRDRALSRATYEDLYGLGWEDVLYYGTYAFSYSRDPKLIRDR